MCIRDRDWDGLVELLQRHPMNHGDEVLSLIARIGIDVYKRQSFGYITDNRNFGYKKTDDGKNDIGDKILSESGTVCLLYTSQESNPPLSEYE